MTWQAIFFFQEREISLPVAGSFRKHTGGENSKKGKFPKNQGAVSPSEAFREWIYWSNRAAYKLAKPLAVSKNSGIRVAKAQSSKFIQTDSLLNDFLQESWNILFTQGLHFYSPGEWFVRHGDKIRSFLEPLNVHLGIIAGFIS